MTGRPKRFGSLVQRAWKHEMIQSYNTHIVEEGYNDFAEAMDLANFDFPDFAVQTMEAYEEHICLQCQRTFGSRTGWASRAFKCHQRVNKARLYAEARIVLHATQSIGSTRDSSITYVTVEGAGELWHEPVWKFPKSQG